MKHSIQAYFLVCGILLFAPMTQAIAAEAMIPHQFTAGTKALASEVNENFSSVKDAVDDNNSRISQDGADIADLLSRVAVLEAKIAEQMTVFLKANGQNIGVLVGGYFNELVDSFIALSFKEYAFEIHAQSGELGQDFLLFSSTDCSGQAYSSAGFFTGQSPPFVENQGVVFASPNPGDPTPVYYIPRGTTSTQITANSTLTDGQGCVGTQLPFVEDVYPVAPNDPAVTGVSNTPFQTPITAGF